MSAVDYDRVNWKDYPETDTPITAENLNKMDEGIYNIAVDVGDMDKIKDESDGTVCGNVEDIRNAAEGIKVYVGDDKKLHFVDATGADTVLNFSGVPSSSKVVAAWGWSGYNNATIGKMYAMFCYTRQYAWQQTARFTGCTNILAFDYLTQDGSGQYDTEYRNASMVIGIATSTSIDSTANQPRIIWELD